MYFSIRRNGGLSLIELLISMVVALIVLGGVVKVVVDSKSTFLLEQEYAFIQENTRFALDEFGYEIRMAGYYGCNTEGQLSNTLDVDPTDSDDWSFLGNAIKGYEADDSDLPSTFKVTSREILVDTDVLIIGRGAQDDSFSVSSHVPASARIALTTSTPPFREGDVLVIADATCENMSIFQMSGPNSVNQNVLHNTGNSVSPGNCSKALSYTNNGGSYTCASGAPANSVKGIEYGPGSSIMRFSTTAYYVADSETTGLPTLYRVALINNSGSAVSQAQELLTGVEDFQVIYGVDSSNPEDGVIDRYYESDAILVDEATAGSSWIGWDRVLTAQVTLTLRSLGPVLSTGDRILRKEVSTTAMIRNRGIQ